MLICHGHLVCHLSKNVFQVFMREREEAQRDSPLFELNIVCQRRTGSQQPEDKKLNEFRITLTANICKSSCFVYIKNLFAF